MKLIVFGVEQMNLGIDGMVLADLMLQGDGIGMEPGKGAIGLPERGIAQDRAGWSRMEQKCLISAILSR